MVRLLPINHKTLIKGLKQFGFDGPYPGGKHLYMAKDDLLLTIPNPHGGDIGPDLLSRILRQARINKEDWERAKEK